MLDNNNNVNASAEATPGPSSSSDAAFTSPSTAPKRKRRPAGTPDPDAEVVSLSPKTLLESDRYVCEFCNQGFQREQNLQMHRRRHKVPWKAAAKRATTAAESEAPKKRVYVCPEASCLHHDARHALGDLVGIKKHYRRKHSNSKQWVCEKCAKGYAVQSDYKAHLKTCGTRGHSCDCGRVFSRVESFIEHQDACTAKRNICSSTTTPSANSPSSDTNFSMPVPLPTLSDPPPSESAQPDHSRLELQLLPSSPALPGPPKDHHTTGLKLSIGPCSAGQKSNNHKIGAGLSGSGSEELMKMAMAEKSYADETRQEARRQTELAEMEFASAKRIREAAKAELEKARVFKEEAMEKISGIMVEITCRACKQKFSEDGVFRPSLDG